MNTPPKTNINTEKNIAPNDLELENIKSEYTLVQPDPDVVRMAKELLSSANDRLTIDGKLESIRDKNTLIMAHNKTIELIMDSLIKYDLIRSTEDLNKNKIVYSKSISNSKLLVEYFNPNQTTVTLPSQTPYPNILGYINNQEIETVVIDAFYKYIYPELKEKFENDNIQLIEI